MAKQRQYEMEILLGARKANTFSSVLGSIKSDLGTLTSTATTVASGIAAAFAGVQIGSIISDATETYKEYESEMAYTASVAKANTAEYEMMDEAAREAGRDTVKTATEATEALSYMALAGWDTTQSVQALPDVLKLSAATSEDLATTSDLVTDSMSAMNVEVGNLGQYLDVVIQANNSANTSASEMMESFIKSGGALRSLNIDLNESATAVGVLANNGTKGEQAGTALNAMLTRMASNSTALKQMEKLGVSVYDASGNFVGFEQALKNINEGLETLGTEAEKNSALSNIAGKQYYSKLIYLLDSVKESADGTASSWDQLSDKLSNSEGSLGTMYDNMTDTFESDTLIMQSALSDLQISFADVFVSGARGPMSALTELMNKASEEIQEFGEENEIEIQNAWDTVEEVGEEIIDFVGDSAEFIIDNFGAIKVAAKGLFAAEVTSKVISGATSIATALKTAALGFSTLTPVGMGAAAVATAVPVIIGAWAAIDEHSKQVAKDLADANLAGHFGDIALSMEEIEELAQQIMGTDMIQMVSALNTAFDDLDSSIESFNTTTEGLDKLNFKVSIGMELTEDDKESYITYAENYIKQAQSVLDENQYTFNLSAKFLLGEDSDLANDMNQYYTELDSQLADLTTQLQSRIEEATSNGFSIDTDKQAQELISQIGEITEKVSTAQTQAKFDAISLQYSGKDLDADTMKELTSQINDIISEEQDAALQAYQDASAQLYLKKENDSDYTDKDYNDDKAEIEAAYYQRQGDALAQGINYITNSIKGAYQDDDALAAMQQQIESLMNDGVDVGSVGQDLETIMDNYLYQIQENGTAGAVGDLYDAGLGNMLDQYDSLIEEMDSKKIEATESMNLSLDNLIDVEAMEGKVDSLGEILGQAISSSDGMTSAVKAAEGVGVDIPDLITEGITNNSTKVKTATDNLMTIIEKSIKEHEGAISIKLTADVINGSTDTSTSEPKKKNARGGIYSSEIWTKFAEDGPEAAIPIDGSERAKGLWKETGARLGMYSNNSGSLRELAGSLEQGGQTQNDTENSIYNFNYSPNIKIEGSASKSNVVQALSISQNEFEKRMKKYTVQKNRVSFSS